MSVYAHVQLRFLGCGNVCCAYTCSQCSNGVLCVAVILSSEAFEITDTIEMVRFRLIFITSGYRALCVWKSSLNL